MTVVLEVARHCLHVVATERRSLVAPDDVGHGGVVAAVPQTVDDVGDQIGIRGDDDDRHLVDRGLGRPDGGGCALPRLVVSLRLSNVVAHCSHVLTLAASSLDKGTFHRVIKCQHGAFRDDPFTRLHLRGEVFHQLGQQPATGTQTLHADSFGFVRRRVCDAGVCDDGLGGVRDDIAVLGSFFLGAFLLVFEFGLVASQHDDRGRAPYQRLEEQCKLSCGQLGACESVRPLVLVALVFEVAICVCVERVEINLEIAMEDSAADAQWLKDALRCVRFHVIPPCL
jgi:hypothetical protein